MVRINSNLILSDHLPPSWQIHHKYFSTIMAPSIAKCAIFVAGFAQAIQNLEFFSELPIMALCSSMFYLPLSGNDQTDKN
jgi:hypothetical protein